MNVFQTFDLFKKEAISVLKDRIFNLVFIDVPDSLDCSVSTIMKDNNEMQINVVNNHKVYSLFTSVLVKKKLMKKNENKNSRICN